MKTDNKITIVLISYHSYKKIFNFLKTIPKNIPILILENSKDKNIKDIKKKYYNINLIYKKNNGYGASINFASKKIKTEYFFVVQPDVIGVNKKSINKFLEYAEKLKDNFSVIGPHFIDAPKKGHFQTELKYKIKKIHNVHGSAMFFNLKMFKKTKGFDENFFLYWEETDYTKRCLRLSLPAYQLNVVKVKHLRGSSVETKNKFQKDYINYLYSWHFIWSKFYFFKKHYGKIFSFIYFFPIIIRSFLKMKYYKNKNLYQYRKYYFRLRGLIFSIMGTKSFYRLEDVKKNLQVMT